MLQKFVFTIAATILGIGLAKSPLKKYQLFNILMEFLGSGGLF